MVEGELNVAGPNEMRSKERNKLIQVIQHILHEPTGALGAGIILTLILIAILAPYI